MNKPPSGTLVFLMEKAMTLVGLIGRKAEEVDRGIIARMLQFPGSSQHFIAARNFLSLELDKSQCVVLAKWYVEDNEETYTTYSKIVYPIDTTLGPQPDQKP